VPTADAGPDQTVASGAGVSLTGAASSDPEGGQTLSYAWTQTDRGHAHRSRPPSPRASPRRPSSRATRPPCSTFSLVVTDPLGASSPADTVTITVNPPANGVPTANAGPDQTVASGAGVSLTGAASSDPEGGTLSYAWTQTSGTAVTLTGATTVSPSFTAPTLLAGDPAAVLEFSLVVTDPLGASSPADTVTITVNPPANGVPTANAGPDQTVASGAGVSLTGAASSDPDGDTLSYAWVQTGGIAVTLSGADTANPAFTAPDAATTLVFQLTVNDGNGGSDTDTVTITVTAPAIDTAQVQKDFRDTTGAFMSRRMERALNSDPRMYRLEHRRSGSYGFLDASSGAEVSQTALDFALRRPAGSGAFIWAEGQYSIYEDRRNSGTVDGSYGVLHFGADTSFGETMTIGLMASIDSISEEQTDQSELSGVGWMIGPYFSMVVSDGLFLSGRVAFGQSDNDADVTSVGIPMTGDFQTDRFLSVLTMTGETQIDDFLVLPEVSIGYTRERQDDYTVSDGQNTVRVAGNDLEYGQMAIAAEFQYPIGDTTKGSFLYARPSVTGIIAGSDYLPGSSNFSSTLEVGYEATPSQFLTYGVSVAYQGIGNTDFEGAAARAFLEWRF
jgi:hypothetical protein